MKKRRYAYFLILIFSLLLDNHYAQAASGKGSEDYYLNTSKAYLLSDQSMTLLVEGVSDEEVSFKSENNSIVSIESTNGNSCECKGHSVGSTTITIKIKKKGTLFFMNSTVTLRCKINVTPNAVSVKFKKRLYKLAEGTKKKATVILRPSITSEKPTFSSSNRKIATINSKGQISAKSEGITTIKATLKNGTTAKCKVIVTE